MKISFRARHKSILSFPDIDLPNFVVITGVNGAGKSHFLEALENGMLRNDAISTWNTPSHHGMPGMHLMPPGSNGEVRRFDWTNLLPTDGVPFAGYQSRQERIAIWTQFKTIQLQFGPAIYQSVAQYATLAQLTLRELTKLECSHLKFLDVPENEVDGVWKTVSETVISVNSQFSQNFILHDRTGRERIIENFQAVIKGPLIAIDENEFYQSLPLAWQPVDMFQQSFARLFVEYQDLWRTNELKLLQNSKGNTLQAFGEAEFVDKYGVPP